MNPEEAIFKCVTRMTKPKKFAEDEEHFYSDSSEDLFDFEEDYDLDEDSESEYLYEPEEDDKEAKEQERYEKALKDYNKAKRECKDLDESACVEDKECEFDSEKSKCGPEMKKPHAP